MQMLQQVMGGINEDLQALREACYEAYEHQDSRLNNIDERITNLESNSTRAASADEATLKELSERGPALDAFRTEYEKLHRALMKSHESENRLIKKTKELITDINNNSDKISRAKKEDEDLQIQKRRLQEESNALLCVVCRCAPRTVLLGPCAHLCVCRPCSRNAALHDCPLCRGRVDAVLRVFV